MAMPYAVISIAAGHTEYIAVTPAGSALTRRNRSASADPPPQFYEWSAKLTRHDRCVTGSVLPPPAPTTTTTAPAHGEP
jgi:hypothetical protein